MRKDLEKMDKKDLIDIILRLKDDLDFEKTILEITKGNEKRLKEENKYLEEENKWLENRYSVQKIKNERGAGRKKKCSDKQIAEILEARKENKSMRAIAKEFSISLGLVQKIISEHKED